MLNANTFNIFALDLNGDDECDEGFYKCHGGRPICIPDSLRCNGQNNCGDANQSDEDKECYSRPWIKKNSRKGGKADNITSV